MIFVDSSVWIDYFRGLLTLQSDRLDTLLAAQPLAVGGICTAHWTSVVHNLRQGPALLSDLRNSSTKGSHIHPSLRWVPPISAK